MRSSNTDDVTLAFFRRNYPNFSYTPKERSFQINDIAIRVPVQFLMRSIVSCAGNLSSHSASHCSSSHLERIRSQTNTLVSIETHPHTPDITKHSHPLLICTIDLQCFIQECSLLFWSRPCRRLAKYQLRLQVPGFRHVTRHQSAYVHTHLSASRWNLTYYFSRTHGVIPGW